MNTLVANLCAALSLALLLQCAAVAGDPTRDATCGDSTPSRGTLIRFFGQRSISARRAVANQRWVTGVADFLERFQLCELFVALVQIQWDVTEWGVGMVTR